MNYSLSFGFLTIGFLVFLFYLILLFLSNRRVRKEERNSLLNSFGFQFYANATMTQRMFLYLSLSISTILILSGECFFFLSTPFTAYEVFLAILFPLSFFCLTLGNILPFRYYKAHLSLSLSGFALFFLSTFLSGIIPFAPSFTLRGANYSTPIFIIFFLLSILSFFSFFNPRLFNWAKMDKTEENGTVYYVKPKLNDFALYEWVYLFLEGVVGLLLLINLFVTHSIPF